MSAPRKSRIDLFEHFHLEQRDGNVTQTHIVVKDAEALQVALKHRMDNAQTRQEFESLVSFGEAASNGIMQVETSIKTPEFPKNTSFSGGRIIDDIDFGDYVGGWQTPESLITIWNAVSRSLALLATWLRSHAISFLAYAKDKLESEEKRRARQKAEIDARQAEYGFETRSDIEPALWRDSDDE